MPRGLNARQKPPIVAIAFLVVFLVGVLYFVATRQLKSSKAHRLRLLAGFSSRVEATIPDLARRFVRIVQETPDANKVRAYVDQIPYLTFLPEGKGRLTEADLRPKDGEKSLVRSTGGGAGGGEEGTPAGSVSGGEDGEDDAGERSEEPREKAPSLRAQPRGSVVYLIYLGPGPCEKERLQDGCIPCSEPNPDPSHRRRIRWLGAFCGTGERVRVPDKVGSSKSSGRYCAEGANIRFICVSTLSLMRGPAALPPEVPEEVAQVGLWAG